MAVWLTIVFLLFLILGGIVDPWMLLYMGPPMLLSYALALWTQHCIHVGSCNSLSWILVAIWFLYGMFIIGTLAYMVYLKRTVLKAAEEATKKNVHHHKKRKDDDDT